MKKRFVLMGVMVISIMFGYLGNVEAEEIYYTNLNGAELTEVQYNNLVLVFGEDTLATMTVDAIELVKNEDDFSVQETSKYVSVIETFDASGNVIDVVQKEISEDEALNFVAFTQKDELYDQNSYTVTHQTTMKKIVMQVVSGLSVSHKITTITNTWLSIPKVKSFDVIALRPGSNSLAVTVNGSTISGYQKYDGNTIGYNADSDNTKVSSSFSGSGGIGISMNLVDSTTTSLENSLTVYFLSSSNPFTVYGTYQHATSDISLSDSQKYTFSASGLGGVLYYSSSSIRSIYDNTAGLELEYNVGDEING